MKKNLLLLFLLLCTVFYAFSQKESYTHDIRGIVFDADTEIPIAGVTIIIDDNGTRFTGQTGTAGEFEIYDVPVGKHILNATILGYKTVTLSDVEVSSGKQTYLVVNMEMMTIETGEVVVTASKGKNKPVNDMAVLSVRSFSVDETEKYAGSLGDPSRMAANFAGVMSVSDQRNDIIIRGNAPTGLLWRLDGINIPNPNHFGALGTTGGPVSILNNNLLTNSDFYTGAFPSEYGNAISGVFDLKMRSGNNQKREYVAQVGFNGFELGAEGPFSKTTKASYLINFRYSTLEVMDKLGFNDGTGASVPQYKDLAFKLNFPLEKGKISIFGIGGLSYIELLDKDTTESSYGTSGTNTYFGSNMGIAGISHSHFINENIKIQNNLAFSSMNSNTKLDSLDENRVPYPYFRNNFTETKLTYVFDFKNRISRKSSFNTGLNIDYFILNLIDSVKRDSDDPLAGTIGKEFMTITDNDDSFILLQAFAQWKYKFTDALTIFSGLHFQQASLNNDYAVEPRLAVEWAPAPKHSFTLGGGLHSMIQPHMIYFIKTEQEDGSSIETNKNLGFTKSIQSAFSYSYFPGKNFRIKLETYFQDLRKVPVNIHNQWYSAVNEGAGFVISSLDSLVNKGTGKNYGVELTIEKFYSKNWYFLFTSSIYDSKYKAYDGIERNTVFNGNYVFNGLIGYEFNIGKNNILEFNVKGVWAGGKRIAPVDLEQSILERKEVIDYSRLYEEKYDDYIKADLRISFKMNRKKTSHEYAIDIQNVTNNKNVFQQFYNPVEEKIQTDYQTGIYPMFLYRFRF